MGIKRKIYPFFFGINEELRIVVEDHERAKNALMARNPVLYNKTMFRAFLNLTKEEVDEMSIDDYMNNVILLNEYLKLLHAPYIQNKV